MGSCCSGSDEKHVKMGDMNKTNRSSTSKRATKNMKGTSLSNDNPQFDDNTKEIFSDFQDKFRDESENLFTDPGNHMSDNEDDEEDMDNDEISLKRKGKTKELFKKAFMNKIIKYCSENVQEKFKELGPFKYRYGRVSQLFFNYLNLN